MDLEEECNIARRSRFTYLKKKKILLTIQIQTKSNLAQGPEQEMWGSYKKQTKLKKEKWISENIRWIIKYSKDINYFQINAILIDLLVVFFGAFYSYGSAFL